MSSLSKIAVLICLVLILPGCLVIVSEEETEPVPVPPPADCPYAEDTIAAIDAVSQLSFDSKKREAYIDIAHRKHLCDAPQVHLVHAALSHLSFENSQEAVLMELINHPQFSPAAEKAILDNIDKLSFEHSKSRIMKAINARHG